MATKSDKKSSGIAAFESSTKRLAEIIEILEDENTSLELALENFEQGVKLTRTTQKSLREAEQKVQLLLQNDDESVFQDFEEQE
jgi:exodeoxyribonuclease VII small subunit